MGHQPLSALGSSVLFQRVINSDGVAPAISPAVNSSKNMAESHSPQNVQLNDVHTIASRPEVMTGKPVLNAPRFSTDNDQMLAEILALTHSDNLTVLDDLHAFRILTPEKTQLAISKVLTEEKNHIERLMEDAQLPDDADLKQLSQAIQLLVASSFFKGSSEENIEGNGVKKGQESIDNVKNKAFVGIVSNDLMVELSKIIRKVMAEINISDRRISAEFLQLNAKMVQASADSTIREGKETFKGALMGFFTSLAITAAGSAFQARGLHQQQKSINNNLIPGNQNVSGASKLSGVNGKVENVSTKPLRLEGKEGSTVTLNNQATQNQKNIVNQRVDEASKRTKDLGLSQHEKHEQIMNKTRVQMGVSEQFSRMSDNAGQLATTSNQVNVKSAEAEKMIEQSIADVARTISSDKDKQVENSLNTAKEMQQSLRTIMDNALKTRQVMVGG
ncbi:MULTISPECIES: type III secretion target, IpaC/SipC family protein [Providencia]|uniref:type III secretion target, IpaC/SipC family protein n=1 Tax=Providencia TaxID=586 RepID=UPI00234A2288|nr:type III secretion target, IpaC/SipC family protein [Providencia sp. PROV143]